VFNVICCSIIGVFKRFKLITNPNPGTSSLPFGVDGGAVFVVFVVVPTEGADTSADVDWDVSCFVSDVVVCTLSTGAITGSGTVTGAGMFTGLIGLVGLTGLLTLVGLIALFAHVFCVSTQDPATGCAYGVGQVEICCCVIDPTYPS
jgi:hypothetical protein